MELLDQVDYYPEEGSDIKQWYTPPYLAQVVHEFPHFNIFLQYVNDTLEMDSNQYVESLCIFSSIFLVMLALTFVVLIGTLMQSLFSSTFDSGYTMNSMKKTLMELTTVVLLFAVIGCWAEVVMHRSIEQMIMEWYLVTKRLDDVAAQSYYLHQVFGEDFMETFSEWEEIPPTESVLDHIKQMETIRAEILSTSRRISKPIIEMQQSKLVMTMLRLESSRASAGMAGWCAAVFLATVGIFASSLTIISRGLAFVAIAALCGITGNYLAAAVGSSVLLAMSDGCIDPYRFALHHLNLVSKFNKYSHFLICEPNEKSKEPQQDISRIYEVMNNLRAVIAESFSLICDDDIGQSLSPNELHID